MYTNHCPLTCWNRKFYIPIRFWTPTCQMKDDCQIPAESRQIFIFCSLKLWSYWTDLHQNFKSCTGISVVINPSTTTPCCILFRNVTAKSEDGQFWRLQKGPKVYRLPLQRLFNYCKNYFSFIICIHEPTNTEMLVKFGPVLAEIFAMTCRFLPFRPKRYRNSLRVTSGTFRRAARQGGDQYVSVCY